MIQYEYKNHKNIYLEDGYKVHTECVRIYDVPELHKAIEEDDRADEKKVYRYINLYDTVKPPKWFSYWMNVNATVMG